MKKIISLLVAGLMALSPSAGATIVLDKVLVDTPSLSHDAAYQADLQGLKVAGLSGQAVVSLAATPAPVTFHAGASSIGSYSITSFALTVATSATNTLTVSSNAGLVGASVSLPGFTLREGIDWAVQSTATGTAASIQAALAKVTILQVSRTGAVITLTAPIGSSYNTMAMATSVPLALVVATPTFTGGRDNASVTINGTKLSQGNQWSAGASNTAAAISLANAVNSSSLLAPLVTATANYPGLGDVELDSNFTGATANLPTTKTGLGLTVSGPTMTGGVTASYSNGQPNISIPAHGLSNGQPVLFTASPSFAGLTSGTTYFANPASADVLRLSTSKANAVANVSINLVINAPQTPATVGTLAALNVSGSPSLKWQSSADGLSWSDLGVSSVPSTVIASSPGQAAWSFGSPTYRFIRAAVQGPATGGIGLKVSLRGTDVPSEQFPSDIVLGSIAGATGTPVPPDIVTGVGVTGRVAKWTAAGVLASASIIDNGSSKNLLDSLSNQSVDWESRALYDGSNIVSAHWNNRTLNDSAGSPILDWNGPTLNAAKPLNITETGSTHVADLYSDFPQSEGLLEVGAKFGNKVQVYGKDNQTNGIRFTDGAATHYSIDSVTDSSVNNDRLTIGNSNGTAMTFAGNGNVAVGPGPWTGFPPNRNLVVAGSMSVKTFFSNELQIGSSSISFTDGNQPFTTIQQDFAGAPGGNLHIFYAYPGQGQNDGLRIANSAVGINKPSPSHTLDVGGEIFSNSSVTASGFFGDGADINGSVLIRNGNALQLYDTLSSHASILFDGDIRMNWPVRLIAGSYLNVDGSSNGNTDGYGIKANAAGIFTIGKVTATGLQSLDGFSPLSVKVPDVGGPGTGSDLTVSGAGVQSGAIPGSNITLNGASGVTGGGIGLSGGSPGSGATGGSISLNAGSGNNPGAMLSLGGGAPSGGLYGQATLGGGSVHIQTQGSDRLVVDSAGAVQVGGLASNLPGPVPAVEVAASGNTAAFLAETFGNGGSDNPVFGGLHAGGTSASPTATPSGAKLAVFSGIGHDGTSFAFGGGGGEMHILASEAWTPSAQGTDWELSLTPIGSTTKSTVLSVTGAGVTTVNAGTHTVYRCVGGADDEMLAAGNTNAGHCVGGTWTATSLKLD